MIKITMSEEGFLTTTRELQLEILAMGREFARNSGVDWEMDYRWMTMTEEAYMLAKIKYPDIFTAVTARRIECQDQKHP